MKFIKWFIKENPFHILIFLLGYFTMFVLWGVFDCFSCPHIPLYVLYATSCIVTIQSNRISQTRLVSATTSGTGVIQIPVVVNVLYRTTAQNISDAQIASQIAVLNNDFKALNTDYNNTTQHKLNSKVT